METIAQLRLNQLKEIKWHILITIVVIIVISVTLLLDVPDFTPGHNGIESEILTKVLFFFKIAPLAWLICVPLYDYFITVGGLKIDNGKFKKNYRSLYIVSMCLAIFSFSPLFSMEVMRLFENNIFYFFFILLIIRISWVQDAAMLKLLKTNYNSEYFDKENTQYESAIRSMDGNESNSETVNNFKQKIHVNNELKESISQTIIFYERIVAYADRLIFYCVIVTGVSYGIIKYIIYHHLGVINKSSQLYSSVEIFFEGGLSFQAILSTAIYLTIYSTFRNKV